MPMLGSHLAITSSIAMLYATLRLVDYSVLKWTTADFPESDFPKKQFLMDYLRWKADEPVLGVALLPTVILFAIAKFDVVVNIVTRAIQVAGGSQSFALRHLFDLFDITVLAITLALYKMLGPSGHRVDRDVRLDCRVPLERARSPQNPRVRGRSDFLRDLYLALFFLNLTTLALPIMRYRFATPAEK